MVYQGTGMAKGTISGKFLAEHMMGQTDPLMDLLTSGAQPSRNFPDPFNRWGVMMNSRWRRAQAGSRSRSTHAGRPQRQGRCRVRRIVGMGAAICERLAASGAAVVVGGRDDRTNCGSSDSVTRSGRPAVAGLGDVANSAEAAALVDSRSRAFGGIDLVINAAG